jgi:ketosteroid isomerase-like protein
MSQENVELVRRCLDAFSRRDVKTLRELNDPDLELDWSASRGALAGVYRGFEEALQNFYGEWYATFDMTVIEPERFIQSNDSIVVPNVARMRGRDGIEVSARSAFVYSVRGGKVTRVCLYQDTEEALNAVGLEG